MTKADDSQCARSIFLATVLLAPGLLAVAPTALASPATCLATIVTVLPDPVFANPGETVRVRVTLKDINDAPDVPGTNNVRVRFDAFYPTTSTTNLFGPAGAIAGPADIGTVFERSFVVPADAQPGQGSLKVEIQDLPNPATSPNEYANSCGRNANDFTRNSGFWVGKKPDLRVKPSGGVALVEHKDGDDALGTAGHATFDAANDLYVRHQPVTGATCVEELPQTEPGRLHFNLTLENAPGAEAPFWALDDSPSSRLPVNIRVFDGNQLIGQDNVTIGLNVGQETKVLLNSTVYNLRGKTGLRDLRFVVDANNRYAEVDEANNAYNTSSDKNSTDAFYVKAADLVPEFGGDVTLNSQNEATGKIRMRNVGDIRAGDVAAGSVCLTRNGGAVFARVYVDRIDPAHEIANVSSSGTTQLAPCSASPQSCVTSDVEFRSKPLSAGQHRILLVADAAPSVGNVTSNVDELNETNNVLEAIVSVQDLLTPTLQNVTLNATAGFRTGSKINFSGNVLDDADFTLPGNNVVLNITYPDGTMVDLGVPKTPTSDAGFLDLPPTGDKDIFWWYNAAFDQEGEYALRIRANDTVHQAFHPLLTADPLRFTLTDFNKTMRLVNLTLCRDLNPETPVVDAGSCVSEPGDSISRQPVNRTFDLNNTVLRVRFEIPPGATGLVNELSNPARKTVEIRDPDGVVLGNFTPTALCWTNITQAYTENCTGASPDCNLPQNTTCYKGAWQLEIGNSRSANHTTTPPSGPDCLPGNTTVVPRFLKPAQWNITIWVGDAGCKFRAHTPDTLSLPVRLRFGLWDTVPARLENSTHIPGSPVPATSALTFRVDAYDNLRINRTFVRVLRDGQEVLLEDLRYTGSNNVNFTGPYSRSFPTGIYTALDLAGEYQWLIGAQDANRTISWQTVSNNSCAPDFGCTLVQRSFRLEDTRAPTITLPGAHLVTSSGVNANATTAFQVGDNLTLEATVEDDTRINVTAEVQQASTGVAVVPARPMLRVGTTSRYRLDTNLTTGPGANLPEGEYQFVLRVRDSGGREASSTLNRFVVAGNLPPSFSQLRPAPDGFGAPNLTIGADIGDALHGVLANTVTMRFGINTPGQAATPVSSLEVTTRETRVGVTNPVLLRASFQLPATVAHGDLVTVTASASDGSPLGLVGNVTWSFRVDGVVPRTVLTCTRSHPAPCSSGGAQLSVRGDTEFQLSATDPDPQNKAASGVVALRFSVAPLGTAGTAQTVAANATSFRLGQFATGDGVYNLKFLAVDAAGNEETERTFVFALDSQGPGIQNTLVTPTSTGWNLTATIADASSDVERARIHVRTGATAFEERPMSRIPDTRFWFGTLPGARRGAQVCYYLEAVDFLGNLATNGTAASPVCFQSENHPPSLTVVSPREGEAIGASMTVRWSVSDLDGDPVTVSLAYRRSSESALVPVPLSTEEQGSRTKVIDTASLINGNYVLQVTASDNQAFNNRTVRTVNLTLGEGGTDTLGRPTLDRTTVAVGEPIKVRVELPGQPSDVQARLLRDGNLVATQDMEQVPPGSRFYEATFVVQEAGVYTVEVIGTDENGIPFRLLAASSLTVSGGFPLVEVALMGVLAAAVVALGVVGLRRRGWL